MSVRLMSLVFLNNKLSSSEKLVLLSIADCANDDGLCWPSLEKLSEKCSMTETGVSRVINRLETNGFLTKKRRFGRSTVYTVSTLDQNCTRIESVSTQEQYQFQPKSKRIYETSKEPSPKQNPDYLEHKIMFEEFWQAYPKQERKGYAFDEYCKARQHTDHKTIINGLKSFKFTNEYKFIERPEKWLHGERWLDEQNTTSDETPEEKEKRFRLEYFNNTGKWRSEWGKEPERKLANG